VILRSGGIRDRTGRLEASAFLIDMNRLFERFVTVQLQRRLAGRFEVRAQEQLYLDMERRIPMPPDLVFYRRGHPRLVADVKYKLTDDGLGRNPDFYQLLAYCGALNLDQGYLIYSADQGALATAAAVVNGGPMLSVRPIQLAGLRAETDRALSALAHELYS